MVPPQEKVGERHQRDPEGGVAGGEERERDGEQDREPPDIPSDGGVDDCQKPAPDRDERERLGGWKPPTDPADTRRLELQVVGEVEEEGDRRDRGGGREGGEVPLPDPEREEEDGDGRPVDEGVPGTEKRHRPDARREEEGKTPPPACVEPAPPAPRKPEEEDQEELVERGHLEGMDVPEEEGEGRELEPGPGDDPVGILERPVEVPAGREEPGDRRWDEEEDRESHPPPPREEQASCGVERHERRPVGSGRDEVEGHLRGDAGDDGEAAHQPVAEVVVDGEVTARKPGVERRHHGLPDHAREEGMVHVLLAEVADGRVHEPDRKRE